jgi:hypothetical protein
MAKPDPNLIKLSPATVMAILVVALLLPLLLTGFISQ